MGMVGRIGGNMPIPEYVRRQIVRLLYDNDLAGLYRSYRWGSDLWEDGFPDIARLEHEVSEAARNGRLSLSQALDVAEWGGIRDRTRIRCSEPIRIILYIDGKPAPWLMSKADEIVHILETWVRGFGPTYSSKFLRFAVPQVYGAIDTRLVRVFGSGDPGMQRYRLLDLEATRFDTRWAVLASQRSWPKEYATWIAILRAIADALNQNEVRCPHPERLTRAGLRADGIWAAADVEMALFSYATGVLEGRY
ncbi:hypothetical protein ASZ90_011038 [hydrocarbon metagenome]|uniref:Uncharacterized protein n=1 Tax=hydrocarbon metagenome TaxID=938273 RepID=A0A0W8FEV8_9ZZZZ